METMQRYKCTICDSSFSEKRILKIHEDSIHRSIRFTCQDCGKTFSLKSSLTVHIDSVHKGIRHKCDECNKEFTNITATSRKWLTVAIFRKWLNCKVA